MVVVVVVVVVVVAMAHQLISLMSLLYEKLNISVSVFS